MYLLLILIAAAVFIGNWMANDISNDYQNGIGKRILRHLAGTLIGALFGLFITLGISKFCSLFVSDETYDELVTHEIVSMGDGSETEGHFFLGCGTMDEKMVYTYYRVVDEGDGFVRRSISSSLTTIHEISGLDIPRIEVSIVGPNVWENNPLSNWFLFNRYEGYQKYDVYIPEGSIIKDIKLDNQ